MGFFFIGEQESSLAGRGVWCAMCALAQATESLLSLELLELKLKLFIAFYVLVK